MFEIIKNYENVNKTFVFQNLETKQSVILNYSLDETRQFVNLNNIFAKHCPINDNKISIYDPNSDNFVSLQNYMGDYGYIDRSILEPQFILVRYETLENLAEQEEVRFSSGPQKKDYRSKERSIGEVIQLVSKWRNLHEHCPKTNNPKKMINLQEAAQLVGISKKSLDDYYCQLRLAQVHNFSFNDHLHEKMGFLRSFVKQSRLNEVQKITRHHKHPKILKIIEDFDTSLSVNKKVQTNQLQGKDKTEDIFSTEKNVIFITQNSQEFNYEKQMNNIENQFYKDFLYPLDDPNDPFLDFNKKISKNIFDDSSDGMLFL